jgi:hypothetical protein
VKKKNRGFMKTRHRLTVLFFGTLLLIGASIGAVSLAQSLEGFVNEGVSYDSILIGKSTENDVIATYGKDYKLINHKGYSYEMIYRNLGLSFYYCAADPNKEIFVIEIEPPSKAVTSKGIKLGESTFADVIELYGDGGETYSEADYDGVYFYSGEDDEDEDSEDARNQTQPAVIDESKIERISEPLGERTDQSNIILDGKDISEDSSSSEEKKSEDDEAPVDETVQTNQKQADEDENTNRRKIVKRIELIEKGGLRQCTEK